MEYFRLIANIDLDAIANNIRQIRTKIKPETKLLAIVKADAYGHGALEVARVSLYNGADQLAVATCDEGVSLRESSIGVPILILGNTVDAQLDKLIKNKLTQTVYSYTTAKKISDAAVRLGMPAFVHIKVDTGMGRIGLKSDEKGLDETDAIFSLPMLNVTGVFTHFATADEADKTFTHEQYRRFRFMTDGMEARGHKGLIRHCANSGAILDMPEYQLDMVRAGIIIYGLFPSDAVNKNINLIPAMNVHTQVSFVKTVSGGTPIGYGRNYYTSGKTKIATIPIGYADGYPRLLSNKGKVIVNGEYANIVGNICMDQAMIDVTHLPDIKEGDDVIILGKSGLKSVTAEQIAQLAQTINYEIVCNFSKRVPRAYYKNGECIYTVKSI